MDILGNQINTFNFEGHEVIGNNKLEVSYITCFKDTKYAVDIPAREVATFLYLKPQIMPNEMIYLQEHFNDLLDPNAKFIHMENLNAADEELTDEQLQEELKKSRGLG